MSGWETLNCSNHPDRIALERCEVCGKPLCAYCLFYTGDGQRLCEKHAQEARRLGLPVEEPAAYADQLIGAQVGAVRKQKHEQNDDGLYRGNSTDVLGFLGLLLGLISLAACCGAAYCLPVVGFVLSLIALINAKDSYDPRRTRRMGLAGLLVSSVWVVVIVACIAVYGLSLSTAFSTFRGPTWYISTLSGATQTPTPTATPTPQRLPEDVPSAAFDYPPAGGAASGWAGQ